MSTATLRTVGGSVVIAIPKRLLELVHLQAGSKVEINVQQGHLIVIPQKKKRYKLSELLAQCDPSLPLPAEEQEWVDAPRFDSKIMQKAFDAYPIPWRNLVRES